MPTAFLIAALIAVAGASPLLIWWKRVRAFLILWTIALLLNWWIIYAAAPSFVWPMFGPYAWFLFLWWIVAAFVGSVIEHGEVRFTPALAVPCVLLLLLSGRACTGCEIFHAKDYASLIGDVEERVWTQDVQPKDPKHVRLVPTELALYLANKQLGEAEGVIGSQFQTSPEHATLQKIHGELWYVVPLDFKDFGVWTSTDAAPGYVLVHGEDPTRPVEVHANERFVYTPGAYFSANLERHLWANGYMQRGLTDFSLEVDDEGKAWWVVTVFEPTIAWWGERVRGVAVVDPTSGAITYHALAEVPDWIDRVIPQSFVAMYLTAHGRLSGGVWNALWAERGVTTPETPSIAYGSDGEPYWVTDITSPNIRDESLVALVYTHTRTGKSVRYKAVGGTEAAVLEAVDNQVAYRKWHGDSPVLYNVYGTMAAIVPLLGESHTYQGVALVRVDTLQVALGTDAHHAFAEYRKLIAGGGQHVEPDPAHGEAQAVGTVARIASEVRGGETTYTLLLAEHAHLFTGTSTLSPELPLTVRGDTVRVGFIPTAERVIPLLAFDNADIADVPAPPTVPATAQQ